MNRAQERGSRLRQDLGLSGCIDAEAVAVSLGLEVHPWPLEVLSELQVDGVVAVAGRLDPEWRRWVIAHAIGHSLLHPGNHVWLRKHMDIPVRYEREAEDFARALLIDDEEALAEGLVHSWEVAEYFGVPDEVLRLEPPFFQASQTTTLEDEPENAQRRGRKVEQRLTDEQERMRIEGLRILTRIIARHALAHPNLQKDRAATEHQPPADGNRKAGS